MTAASGVTAFKNRMSLLYREPWWLTTSTSTSGSGYVSASFRSVEPDMSPVISRSKSPDVASAVSPSSFRSPPDCTGG